jgi:malonyl CoA-acyl carrier protein transacylase/phosphopantetheinyl transferase
VHRLLRYLGLRADACVGHSTGEFSAAHAAGALRLGTEARAAAFSTGLNDAYHAAMASDDVPRAVLLAVAAEREQLEAIAREAGGELSVAMDNCPHQAVLVGEPAAAERARAILQREGLIFEQLPYDRAVHTPRFAAFVDRLRGVFAATEVGPPAAALYSCTTTARYPDEPEAIRELLAGHWTAPVEFRRTIEALYDEGARVFVECGPRGNLTAFVEDILRGREFCAVPVDVQRRSGTTQLNHLVAMLLVHGVELDVAQLYADRGARLVEWEATPVAPEPAHEVPLATGWPMLRLRDAAIAPLRTPVVAPPRPVETPAVAGGDDIEAAMRAHLHTMGAFLSAQEEVMQAFLAPPQVELHPLLGTVVSLTPGAELMTRRVIEPAEDRYLDDHRLGGGLAVMPLAMSISILAEAAAALAPDLGVTGLRDVRAHRWLAFGDEPVTVEVRARRQPHDDGSVRVHAELHALGDDGDPVVEGTVLLGTALPPPPSPLPAPADARPPRCGEVYGDVMFHGPRWQAIRAVEATGADGARARLEVLPLDGFLASEHLPDLAVDPIALDAAGQLVGVWAADRLDTARVIFPFRLAALDLHSPPPPVGEMLECAAATERVGDVLLRSDIDVRPAGGPAWMRLGGWEDKRFDVPPQFEPLVLDAGHMSEPWQLPVNGACRRMTARVPRDGGPWLQAWEQRVLSAAEREQLRRLRAPEPRRLEWLGARTAAKEAVQQLVREHRGIEPRLAEIELVPDDAGRPVVRGLDPAPVVSLSHTDGRAVALAALEGRVGIDIERLGPRPAGFREAAFGGEERELFDGDEWMLRCWCAKEAVAKAAGSGLAGNPRSAQIVAVDLATGRIDVAFAGERMVAHSFRDGDLIVATTDGGPA